MATHDLSIHFLETLTSDLRRIKQAHEVSTAPPRVRPIRTMACLVIGVLSLTLISG